MADENGLPTIDYIYELLEQLDLEEKDLKKRKPRKALDLYEFPTICEAVEFLDGQGYGNRLGLSAMDLDKVLRVRGSLVTAVLLKLSSRAQHLLREVEGELKGVSLSTLPLQEEPQEREETPFTVLATKWVPLRHDQNGELIATISTLLDDAISLARGSNLPPDRAALTALQRNELIALLETTLAMLKAPLVEGGLLKKTTDAALRGAASGLQKGVEIALSATLKKAAEQILLLLQNLF